MIRTIFAVIFIALFLILSSPLMAFEYFYHKKHPKEADLQSLHIVQWAFKVVLFICGTTYDIEGMEKIPKDQGVLFVANHISMFDVVLVYSLLPYATGFVSKDGVLKVPLLRVWMRRLHCLFLDRENPRSGMQMILDSIESIKSGISIFIFPEGTRSKTGELLEFKPGAVKAASKIGCPIIPIAIKGTRDVLENHFPRVKKAHATVTFLDPVYPETLEGDQKKHLAAYVHDLIAEELTH
ncbi:MAG: 1-acyl-sn-glycerol-3-phosphate acyltransferase [Lachnospiraceae bacterium]|nr:1-acyl-sn-glycerol-3-phosphate acyltransferase [Lachnospiraceae bacterium]